MSTMTDKTVAVVKGLIMDGVAKANSGHPGGAMSSADFATILYSEFLNTDPDDPDWFNRDRFVLAAGHESMLLYSLLHLKGLIGLDDLKAFRQLGSLHARPPRGGRDPRRGSHLRPPGPGVCRVRGLCRGRGLPARQAGRATIMDHYTYALSCDGDIQEPVALGAASLAGLWGLGRLIVYYDSNKIQLAGPVLQGGLHRPPQGLRRDCAGRCSKWTATTTTRSARPSRTAQQETAKPTLIIGHTTMAKGAATMEGSHKTHGSPLSAEEIAATKAKLGLDAGDFQVPEDVVAHFRSRDDGLRQNAADWRAMVRDPSWADAGFADMWGHVTKPRPELDIPWPEFTPGETMATRKAWGACLERRVRVPAHPGGRLGRPGPVQPDPEIPRHLRRLRRGRPSGARNLAFGVREFPMAAIMNGIAAARRPDAVRGHVPDLFRLLPQCHPHVLPAGAARALRVHPRFLLGGRGRPDPSARGAHQLPAG